MFCRFPEGIGIELVVEILPLRDIWMKHSGKKTRQETNCAWKNSVFFFEKPIG
jgi:hypothetical protein